MLNKLMGTVADQKKLLSGHAAVLVTPTRAYL